MRLVETVEDLKSSGYRLGQICASLVGDGIRLLTPSTRTTSSRTSRCSWPKVKRS